MRLSSIKDSQHAGSRFPLNLRNGPKKTKAYCVGLRTAPEMPDPEQLRLVSISLTAVKRIKCLSRKQGIKQTP